jgi:hypothetical protein
VETLCWLYELIVVTRDLDGEFVNLQRLGDLALFPSYRGQDAAQIGATACLGEAHWLFPQYRAAMVAQRLGEDSVAVAHLGDGVIKEGDVHEALNFAAVFKGPRIFYVQNNPEQAAGGIVHRAQGGWVRDAWHSRGRQRPVGLLRGDGGQRAVVVDSAVVARPTMTLTSAFDHRIADGAQVAQFLCATQELLESPEMVLLDL